MIKGLMLTPPVVGRISIGKLVERANKRLPQKNDEFTLTTQVQTRGGWALHPLDGVLRAELRDRAMVAGSMQVLEGVGDDAMPAPQVASAAHAKLRNIPVRLLFNDPHLNLRASYTLFDRATARPMCVGDGQQCKRVTASGVESLPCPGPDHCPMGIEGGCKLFGRLHVRIDHPENQSDALSTFVLRTTSVNTVRTLLARMHYLQAVSGGLLAHLSLELRLRGKSTAQSHRAPIYYVDLGLRAPAQLEVAVVQAREESTRARAAGLDMQALESAAREGFALGLFEDTEEDAPAVVEEFYPQVHHDEIAEEETSSFSQHGAQLVQTTALAARLHNKASCIADSLSKANPAV